jgi:hypothetical protein
MHATKQLVKKGFDKFREACLYNWASAFWAPRKELGMKDDSKLADLLRVEWRELLDQKHALEGRMRAIELLLGGTADEEQEALRKLDEADDAAAKDKAPRAKRKRRTNAEIAADNAAAESLRKAGEEAQKPNYGGPPVDANEEAQ